jgi:hypothetical protein
MIVFLIEAQLRDGGWYTTSSIKRQCAWQIDTEQRFQKGKYLMGNKKIRLYGQTREERLIIIGGHTIIVDYLLELEKLGYVEKRERYSHDGIEWRLKDKDGLSTWIETQDYDQRHQ